MNKLLVIFQFKHDSPKPWSQSQIQQIMTRRHATYVSRGVYMVSTPQTPDQLRDELIKAAELTDRDFIGVYTAEGPYSSRGHFQLGAAQPQWPNEEPSFPTSGPSLPPN